MWYFILPNCRKVITLYREPNLHEGYNGKIQSVPGMLLNFPYHLYIGDAKYNDLKEIVYHVSVSNFTAKQLLLNSGC